MGEIGTDENFGDKTGGDRPREHCIGILDVARLVHGYFIFCLPHNYHAFLTCLILCMASHPLFDNSDCPNSGGFILQYWR